MRILHSSDWHLGQHFMGRSRQSEHQALIDWLLEQVEQLQIDLVLIAGDLFDTGTPPSYARELFNQLVMGLQVQSCQLLVIAGNHDSVATLSEGVALFRQLGTEICPVATQPRGTLYQAKNRAGITEAIIIACPYLRARDLIQSKAGQSSDDKRKALQSAIEAFFNDSYQAAQTLSASLQAEQKSESLPILLSAHLTAVGGALTESVRELYIGTLDAFAGELFPPADYIALGHLHRPQRIKGPQPIYYSGSPIPLSFDEANATKSMQLIECQPGHALKLQALNIPCFQPLAAISGNLATLEKQLQAILQEKPLMATQKLWLEVCIEEDDYLSDLMVRIETLLADYPVELLRIKRQRAQRQSGVEMQTPRETLVELAPEEVFSRRLQQESLPSERLQMLHAAFTEVCAEIESGIEDQTHGQQVRR